MSLITAVAMLASRELREREREKSMSSDGTQASRFHGQFLQGFSHTLFHSFAMWCLVKASSLSLSHPQSVPWAIVSIATTMADLNLFLPSLTAWSSINFVNRIPNYVHVIFWNPSIQLTLSTSIWYNPWNWMARAAIAPTAAIAHRLLLSIHAVTVHS